MITAIARNLMAEMKLIGMFEAFDMLMTQATRDQWSCSDFLDAMLQAESDFRNERKTKLRIKAAIFALRPTFEDFEFTANRSITQARIKELYSLHWLSEARPVLLIGQTGQSRACRGDYQHHRRELQRGQRSQTCGREEKWVNVRPNGAAGDPCNVGPKSGNLYGVARVGKRCFIRFLPCERDWRVRRDIEEETASLYTTFLGWPRLAPRSSGPK